VKRAGPGNKASLRVDGQAIVGNVVPVNGRQDVKVEVTLS
jgi:hypothetical protein